MDTRGTHTLVVGVLAKTGGGKGSFVEEMLACAAENGIRAAKCRFSDIPRALCVAEGIPDTRENLQRLVVRLRDTEGKDALSRRVRALIQELCAEENRLILVDGVRWLADEEMILSFPHALFVFISASEKDRYARIRNRSENSGDTAKTWEAFLAEDNAEPERMIEDIATRARVSVRNDGSSVESEQKYRATLRVLWDSSIAPRLLSL